jgi:hypothetical protein
MRQGDHYVQSSRSQARASKPGERLQGPFLCCGFLIGRIGIERGVVLACDASNCPARLLGEHALTNGTTRTPSRANLRNTLAAFEGREVVLM